MDAFDVFEMEGTMELREKASPPGPLSISLCRGGQGVRPLS